MKELIKDKKQIVVIHTGTHNTINGGIVRHYKTYVINEDNSRLYNISYIMKEIGFKVNKNSEILINYSGSHKDLIMDKLKKYFNMDIEILSDM